METPSFISIIIPCYNHGEFIEKAVYSALEQTYPNKEIIIIDDGSNTQTKKVLQKMKPKIDLLITQKNQGVVIARNEGVRMAKGNYILTLDADDYFEPGFLEKAVKILDANKKVGIVTCWSSVENSSCEQTRISKPTGANAFEGLFHNNASASILFRKRCWEEVDGYDNNLSMGYEDWEFGIAIGKKGWEIHVIPEILFHYRNLPDSRNKKARKYYPEIRRYVYKKHKDLLVQNLDQTIENFLKEIEFKNKDLEGLKNSHSYKIGKTVFKTWHKLMSFFPGKS